MRIPLSTLAAALVIGTSLVSTTASTNTSETTITTTATTTSWSSIADLRAQFQQDGPDAPVLTVAHLGDWRHAPENSVPAIQGSIDMGVPIVEADVRRTSDGSLVLMHDESVNRTTNGTGNVTDLTLDQIRSLRLKNYRGGNAALTDVQVPTLQEVFTTIKDKALLNVDKSWALREQIWDLAVEYGVEDQIIFKSNADPAEAESFLDAHPDALYVQVIESGNSEDIGAFTTHQPDAYEIVYTRLTDQQIQPSVIDGVEDESRIWMNTMWRNLSAGYTDELSLRNSDDGWGAVTGRHHANIIQTDTPAELLRWISEGEPAEWDTTTDGVIRVEAEDYSTGGKDVGYHDVEDANQGGAARTYEGVDLCDQQGSLILCYIRAGEWVKYDVDVPATGDYAVTARVSSPYNPAGTFSLSAGSSSTGNVVALTTTGHDYLMEQQIGTLHLEEGTQQLTLQIDANAAQNFNIDWFEFTPVS